MNSIKAFLQNKTAMLLALGAWGLFAMAALDGAGIPLPAVLDGTVVTLVIRNRALWWVYTLAAAAGSTLGCVFLYGIGYKGGEVLVERRMSPAKFAKVRLSFERHPVLALGVPAMLPPPFPFKVIVLAAAAFEMNFGKFLITIFAGRVVRFGSIALVAALFGEQIVAWFVAMYKEHRVLLFIGIAVAVLLPVWWQFGRRKTATA